MFAPLVVADHPRKDVRLGTAFVALETFVFGFRSAPRLGGRRRPRIARGRGRSTHRLNAVGFFRRLPRRKFLQHVRPGRTMQIFYARGHGEPGII